MKKHRKNKLKNIQDYPKSNDFFIISKNKVYIIINNNNKYYYINIYNVLY